MDGHSMGGDPMTTPECRASDTSFLTTLAYCLNSTCAQDDVPAWKLEKYWADECTGDPSVAPKWTYAQSLSQVTEPPTREVTEEDTLNFTGIVPHDSWEIGYYTDINFEWEETLHPRFGYVYSGSFAGVSEH